MILLLKRYNPPLPEISGCKVRFQLPTEHFYLAEVTNLSQGIAVGLHCSDASTASGEIPDSLGMSMVAMELLETVQALMRQLSQLNCPGMQWALAFPSYSARE